MTTRAVLTGSSIRRHHVRRLVACLLVALVLAIATPALAQDLTLVSNAVSTSLTANGMSTIANTSGGRTMSTDGRFLVFTSEATNLVAGQVDTNGQQDVFLRDRLTGVTTLVSHAAGAPATAANGFSLDPVISADGGWVAFISDATNLVTGSDTNDDFDVFLYERATGTVRLLSHVPGDLATTGNAGSFGPTISGDGNLVAFESLATDLVTATDTNDTFDVFLYARSTGSVTLVSHPAAVPSRTANGSSLGPVINTNGTFVAYGSLATDVTGATDTNDASDIFLWERATRAVTLVSHAAGTPGSTADGASSSPVISADAGVVAFNSVATNLVAGSDTNEDLDVFVYERATDTVTLVSHAAGAPGTAGNGIALYPAVSADGAFVAFASEAADLVVGSDTNADFDVFLYERATGVVTLVSHVPGAPGTAANSASMRPDLSADGSIVVFDSLATNLFAGTDLAGTADIFRYERATGALTLISHMPGAPAQAGNHSSGAAIVSGDGSIIAFETDATNLLLTSDDNIVSDVMFYKRVPVSDLVESALGNPPSNALPGTTFTVSETVLNQGEATAGASITRYYLSLDTLKTPDDALLSGTRSVSGLAPGGSSPGSRTVTILSGTPLGTYYLLACADDTKAVSERDELNNCRASTTTITVGRPDLIVSSVANPPATVAPGGSFSTTETVRNQGTATAGSSGTRYYLSPDPAKTAQSRLLTGMRVVASLDAGVASTGSTTLTVPTTTPLGSYYVVACADDFLKVVETDESNNCTVAATQIAVQRPDLVVTQVSSPPAVVLPGGSFAVTDTVMNQGGAQAIASGTRYYLSPTPTKSSQSRLLSGTRMVPPLAPNTSSQAAKTVTVATGTPLTTYYLHACADDLRQVVEGDETNNCAVAATQVTVGRPDLVVSAVTNPPATAARGSTFSVSDTVTNQGLLVANPTTTRFYLSIDTARNSGDLLMVGTRSVPELAAGASSPAPSPVTVTIPTSMATGNYWLLACADDRAIVVEAVETNNCHASSTRVSVH